MLGGILGVRPSAQVETAFLGDAERIGLLRGGHQQRGRHVDVHHRHLVLGVRPTDVAVFGGWGADRRGVERRSGATRAGWSPRRRSSPTSSSRPRRRRRRSEAPSRARRAVSHSGKVSHACITSWASLRRMRRLPRERRGLPVAPRQPVAALLRGAHGGQRLRAADQREVHLPAQHRQRRPVHQHPAGWCRRFPSRADGAGVAPRTVASRPTGSSYGQLWQYTICSESICGRTCSTPATRAASWARSAQLASGSGASPSRTVRWDAPMTQSRRGRSAGPTYAAPVVQGSRLMPWKNDDRRRSGSAVTASPGTFGYNSSSSTRSSSRASWAPRQKCVPPPPNAA